MSGELNVLAGFITCDTAVCLKRIGADSDCSGGMNLARADIDVCFAFLAPSVCHERLSWDVLLSSAAFDRTAEIIHHIDLPSQP